MSLAAVRDLREVCAGAGPEELVDFETHVLVGFVLARRRPGSPTAPSAPTSCTSSKCGRGWDDRCGR